MKERSNKITKVGPSYVHDAQIAGLNLDGLCSIYLLDLVTFVPQRFDLDSLHLYSTLELSKSFTCNFI